MRKESVIQPKITAAVEALYGLHVGVVGRGTDRHERPHKPVLLLAVLDLIAPTPDGVWEVSRKRIAHRSLGESALLELRGRQFIPPADSAYHPAVAGLEWRVQRLGPFRGGHKT